MFDAVEVSEMFAELSGYGRYWEAIERYLFWVARRERDRKREYRQGHKEVLRERDKRYQARNIERVREWNRRNARAYRARKKEQQKWNS